MENLLHFFKKGFFRFLGCCFLLCSFQYACKKEKAVPEYPLGSNEHINTWMLDSLKRYYYWNESLPAKPNISSSPKDFFASIQNASDRFSYILLPNDPSSFSKSAKGKYGFDYSAVKELNTAEVIGVVKLVSNDSPASRSGLERGDYIRKINGELLTETNAEALQAELLSGGQVTLTLSRLSGNSWVDTRSVEITAGAILDQHETSRILESNGKKIGYLYFDSFNPGLASSLTRLFANFKTAGISDLILDLRYNSGGQVAEAAGLCAMIPAGVSFNDPFITYKGNKNGGVKNETLGTAATFDKTVDFNTLLQNNLGLSRIYILSTGATASAAEVMINNLKPFMQVVLIGSQTRGKDEASFLISDMRKPKQVQWEMHPIIYKLFNASGNGNYSAGIKPDILVNELESLPLVPFGDSSDPLLRAAVSRISGKTGVSGLIAKKGFRAGDLLTDTRSSRAAQSIVLTHR